MFESLSDLWADHVWSLVMAGGLVVSGIGLSWHALRLRRRDDQLRAALNNMSQGLCMWSPLARLILCNDRYIQMYDLAPHLTRPGSSLREMLEQRIAVGSFSGNPDQYIADLLSNVAKGKTTTTVREHQGRFIAIVNRPMPGGGWVATHEDITEQRLAEMQRSSMAELENRRATIEEAIAGFRQRVENVLTVVSDGAGSMQHTASGLFASSDQTSQRAQRAVDASQRASASAASAASAASEMSRSISEISQQLTRTTDVMRAALDEAQVTNQRISSLAEAAQKIGDVIKLIRDIAGQTNLLALNATIEAARAGEMGRGFGVVAHEVKQLATRTSRATEEVRGGLNGITAASSRIAERVGKLVASIDQVAAVAAAIAGSIRQQDANSQAITSTTARTADDVRDVAANVKDVAGMIGQTKQAADLVTKVSTDLGQQASDLRAAVERFIETTQRIAA
jgi:methyl-accepting chemotaxis protein